MPKAADAADGADEHRQGRDLRVAGGEQRAQCIVSSHHMRPTQASRNIAAPQRPLNSR